MKSWKLVALSATIILTLLTPAEAAAPKAGNKCPKKNAVVVSAGMSFTCKLVGKKLVWSKGIRVKAPTPAPTPTPTPTPTATPTPNPTPTPTPTPTSPTSTVSDVSAFSNLEPCKIVDGDPQLTNMSAGFPIPAGRIDLVKGAKIHVIGVDFPDKPVTGKTPREINEYLAIGTEKFWRAQSSVPVKFDWVWNNSWLRFPGSINSYSLGGSFFEGKFNGPAYFNLANQVIAAVDAETDFTGANFLFIVFPPGVKNEEIGTFLVHTQGVYRTNEGSIYNLIMAGGDYANLDTYIHEFGHGLGLTDIRDTTDLAQQKSDGMYYDTMNNPTYPELLVWHRFLLGFLQPSQIHCKVNAETSRHWIVPVASDSQGVKGLVIPLSSTEAIIVESRRAIGFDTKLASRLDLVGAVVYTLDSKVPYRRTPVKVAQVLQPGSSVVVNGYKISVIESGQFGDVIQVERG